MDRQRRLGIRARGRGASAAAAMLLALLPACMPDIGEDPVPEALEFDPTTGRVPEPTLLVMDPATGLVDLSLAGVDVPADCLALPQTAIADCQLNQYIESLDGFPPTTAIRAPATAALDPATLTAANVVLVDVAAGKAVADVKAAFDAAGNYVTLAPKAPLPTGTLYVGAVRGYADGVKAAGGAEVTGTSITALLKSATSLTCGAAAAKDIPAGCGALVLLAQQMPEADARASLVDLEAVRSQMNALHAWEALEAATGMTRDDAAVLWAFPTHSAPVIDVDPGTGILPVVKGQDEIRLAVNGAVDAATVTPWSFDAPGSVFLLDLTALAADDLAGGVPAFAVSMDGATMVLKADAAMTTGHTMAILVTTGVRNGAGVSLVPPPMTVLLKAAGPIADATGKSLVSGVDDASAAQLEAGRKDFATLLDDELFASLTGLNRDGLAYVYAFDFPNP
jgi:hypothetical protein